MILKMQGEFHNSQIKLNSPCISKISESTLYNIITKKQQNPHIIHQNSYYPAAEHPSPRLLSEVVSERSRGVDAGEGRGEVFLTIPCILKIFVYTLC